MLSILWIRIPGTSEGTWHSQQTLECVWEEDINTGNKKHFLCSLQISPFIPFSYIFIKMHWKRLSCQLGQDRGNKTSPGTTTNLNELKVNTHLLESNDINLYYSHGKIFKLAIFKSYNDNSHSKVNFITPMFPSKLRKSCVEDSIQHHHHHLLLPKHCQDLEILVQIPNVWKLHIYGNRRRLDSPSGLPWHQAKQG